MRGGRAGDEHWRRSGSACAAALRGRRKSTPGISGVASAASAPLPQRKFPAGPPRRASRRGRFRRNSTRAAARRSAPAARRAPPRPAPLLDDQHPVDVGLMMHLPHRDDDARQFGHQRLRVRGRFDRPAASANSEKMQLTVQQGRQFEPLPMLIHDQLQPGRCADGTAHRQVCDTDAAGHAAHRFQPRGLHRVADLLQAVPAPRSPVGRRFPFSPRWTDSGR